ncbi:hypothetical protein EV659_103210 [Rhodothalassium salexigens DSM 2132]|uniref:Uncharacterized protein n=1 Tax=Rhodothalassium salexigens DSM 2132 TaxID=1188247 RepID=A0A4R2PQ35_RHOSA|nr:hypothetical protein [Rhodothalassium salexigens]MBB4211021.1 hypothetical protein [Rhodothalassium salexigens DSM 2132]MBK1639924.1 hypothetical protein [Rhodothalassium salexigens DSM 2132]TCP36321.1 hypothetical protein EV659_103210 [Rhodothalassium salexigens DSM 2132]
MTGAMAASTALAGSAALLAGLGLLYAAWARPARGRWPVLAGWMAALVGAVLWGLADGGDRGVAVGVVVFVALALAVLLWRRRRGPVAAVRAGSAGRAAPTVPTAPTATTGAGQAGLGRRIGVGLLVGPGAGLAAVALVLALFGALDRAGAHVTAAIVAGYVVLPLLWAGLAVWALMAPGLARKVAVVAGPGALGAGLFWLLV